MRPEIHYVNAQRRRGDAVAADYVPISFFAGPCIERAGELLGKLLIRETDDGLMGGIIVETEAYLAENDPACHSPARWGGNTAVGSPMAGTLYVYTIHGHCCLNIITACEQEAGCVLVRAIEPTHGVDEMTARRPKRRTEQLARGPGNLCRALAVTRAHSGRRLGEAPLYVLETRCAAPVVVATGRVGVSQAADRRLRFLVKDSPFVSRG